jgi:CRP-like cAMP-binding protein
MKATERVTFLGQFAPFRDLKGDDFEVLEGVLRDAVFPRGQEIFKLGDESTTMYVIRKGYVRIFRRNREEEKTIAVASPGEFFGEMALVDSATRSANVTASDDVSALTITKRNMEFLEAKYPAVAFRIYMILMRVLSGRLRRTFKKTTE